MRMTKLFLTGVMSALAIISCNESPKPDDKLPVEVLAIPLKDGWGYEIYVDNKIFIKQNFIPAVSGYHTFKNKDQAILTGKIVLKKMQLGKPPLITLDDLKQLGVTINFGN